MEFSSERKYLLMLQFKKLTCLKLHIGERHSAEVAFVFLTVPSRVQISALTKLSDNWNFKRSDLR